MAASIGHDDREGADEFFDDEQELMAATEPTVDAAVRDDSACSKDSSEQAKDGDGAQNIIADATQDDSTLGVRADAESKPAPAAPVRTAPPFWMVLAIAGVALVLGIVIGYLIGTSATIAELANGGGDDSAAQGSPASQDGVSMPEGHPNVTVDEDGTASVDEGSGGSVTASDPLTLANNYFDMGMSAMQSARDEKAQAQAAELFRQAIAHYDEYLAGNESPSAEVDRAICVFYAGDHDAAIADLEVFTKRDATFAPAWANLGMFYEAHGDTKKAVDAYEHALKAAEKEDTYGVRDYAQQHLDALKSK